MFFQIKYLFKNLLHKRLQPQKKSFFNKNVPYFSQWESKKLVKDIIFGKISAKDDPLWKKSGAKTKKEYELWSWNGCAMACLKMIIAYKFKKEIPLVKLGFDCQKFKGYILKNNNLEGLYYKPFLRFIEKDFNLKGKIISPMFLEEIIEELDKGNFVICSVSHEIRNPKVKPLKKGGHLIFVLGYDLVNQSLVFHNPSGIDLKTQKYTRISFEDFRKFFAYKGIVIFND